MSEVARTNDVLDVEYYPCSDGAPMGETPQHIKNLMCTFLALDHHFRDDPNVYVAGNMFVYYVPGNRLRHVSPDVFVVLGVPKHTEPERRRYLVWDDKPMDCVFEFTSESTREEDVDDKMAIYRQIGVREYFLFDPYAEYLNPYLQGHRLVDGEWTPIEPVNERLPSETLGLYVEAEFDLLRLYDPSTRKWLPTPSEESESRRLAEQMVLQERRQREEERRQREEERRQREEAERLAAEERRQREEVERQLEELQRRLSQQHENGPEPKD